MFRIQVWVKPARILSSGVHSPIHHRCSSTTKQLVVVLFLSQSTLSRPQVWVKPARAGHTSSPGTVGKSSGKRARTMEAVQLGLTLILRVSLGPLGLLGLLRLHHLSYHVVIPVIQEEVVFLIRDSRVGLDTGFQ